jgi:flagellin-like hook-associated protein FlgL
MAITKVGGRMAMSVQTLVDMRNQLTDLQRQLATGKKSESYAGLGLDRGLTVGLRGHVSAIEGYQQSIGLVDVRLGVAQTALSNIAEVTRSSKIMTLQSKFVLNGGNQTTEQKTAFTQLDEVLGQLNVQAGDRWIFSGAAGDRPAAESTDHVMDGDGARAGLKQIIAERRLADLGAGGLGRLSINAPVAPATNVTITEDAAPPFGMKLASVTSNLTGAIITGPAGAPPSLDIDLAVNPNDGDDIEIFFTLPDGSTESITLTATNSLTPGPNEFQIAGTATATRDNMNTILNGALSQLAGTSLAAASALAAGQDFFDIDSADPPMRVVGPPFDTAVAMVAGTSSNTVTWYTGEAGTGSARATATARIDQSLVVNYGMRANEDALRITVQNIAVFAACTFSSGNPNAEGEYNALTQRVAAALNGVPGQQRIADIEAELAGAQTAMQAANERHDQTGAMMEDFLQRIEGAPKEEIGATLLALQTSLQATLQTTAMLMQTNLLNYI